VQAFRKAPYDDEPIDDEEQDAIREAEKDIEKGHIQPLERGVIKSVRSL